MKTRTRLLPALAALAMLAAGTGCVTAYGQPRYGGPYGGGYADVGRIAYDNGYRRGVDHGYADARSGRGPNYRNHRDYRDADWGYDHRFGARGEYRRAFRRGYEAGYRDGFAREARGYNRYPDARSGSYGYASPAYERGFRDGLEKGRDDGRDGDRYDPLRHKWYREGDRGYNSRFGPRDQYKAAYREAFRQGYEQGYREGRYRR